MLLQQNYSVSQRFFGLMAIALVTLGLIGCEAEKRTSGSAAQDSLRLAQFYFDQGQYRSSIVEAKNALKADPQSADTYLLLGRIQLSVEDGKGAAEAFEQARTLGSQEPDLERLVTEALLAQGKFAAIVERVAEMPAEPDAVMQVVAGEAQLGLGDVDAAEGHFRSALAASEDKNPAAWVGLAKVSLARGERPQVDEYLDRALSVDPEFVDGWVWRGRIALLKDDLTTAERAYFKVRELDSNDLLTRRKIEALHGVMKAKIGLKRTEEALKYYQDFLDFYPNSLLAEYERGLALFKRGDVGKAEEVFEAIVSRAPAHDQSVMLLGYIAFAKGDDTRVADLLESHLDGKSANPLGRRLYAMSMLRMGNPQEALRVLKPDAEKENAAAETLSLYGVALLSTGAPDDARTMLERAFELAPDNADVRLNLARYYVLSRSADNAAKILKGMEGSMNSAGAEYLRVAVSLLRNDPPGARKQAQRLITEAQGENIESVLAGVSASALSIGRLDWVKQFLNEEAQRSSEKTPYMVVLGNVCLRTNDADCAVRAAQTIIDANSSSDAGWELLARAETAAARPAKAVDAYQKLADLNPEEARPLAMLAGALFRAGAADDARKTIAQALALDKQDREALRLGIALDLQAGDDLLAAERLSTLQAVDPDSASTRELGADLMMRQQDFAGAAVAYADMLRRKPASAIAIKRFSAEQQAGNKDAAFRNLEEWVVAHPNDARAASALASAYLIDGQNEKAIVRFESLLERSPKSAGLLNNLAWLYQEEGDARALDFAERAYAAGPESAEICDTLGWILVERGALDRGVKLLEKAARLAPGHKGIEDHLAQARQRAAGN